MCRYSEFGIVARKARTVGWYLLTVVGLRPRSFSRKRSYLRTRSIGVSSAGLQRVGRIRPDSRSLLSNWRAFDSFLGGLRCGSHSPKNVSHAVHRELRQRVAELRASDSRSQRTKVSAGHWSKHSPRPRDGRQERRHPRLRALYAVSVEMRDSGETVRKTKVFPAWMHAGHLGRQLDHSKC